MWFLATQEGQIGLVGSVVPARETPLYGLFRISRQSLEEVFSETHLQLIERLCVRSGVNRHCVPR
jgi:hypothetical protein